MCVICRAGKPLCPRPVMKHGETWEDLRKENGNRRLLQAGKLSNEKAKLELTSTDDYRSFLGLTDHN